MTVEPSQLFGRADGIIFPGSVLVFSIRASISNCRKTLVIDDNGVENI